jgi:hypothetical protein
MGRARSYLRDEEATAAAEFAFVLPIFLTLVLTILGMSLMLYANTTLHYAAEEAARCYSVKTAICSDATATQNYALSHYTGPDVTPVFVASATGCGHTVSATGSYPFNAVLVNISIPLSTTACFP